MQTDSIKSVSEFMGLNNISDPMRPIGDASWEWQSIADNVDGTDTSGIALRTGYSAFLSGTSISASYSTFDYSRLYIVDSGTLYQVNADGTQVQLYTGLTGTARFGEINDTVYVSCDTKLEVRPDGAVSIWGVPTPAAPVLSAASGRLVAGTVQVVITYVDAYGKEGGASTYVDLFVSDGGGVTVSDIPALADYRTNVYCTEPDGAVFYLSTTLDTQTACVITAPPLGAELTTQFLDPPPVEVSYVAAMGANLYAAQYISEIDQTVVWFTQALGYRLFNLNSDFFVVPGECTQLHGSDNGLVVATQNRIYVYNDDKLAQVAEYGAVHGAHADRAPDGKTYFWSKRGLCRIAPFENITETRISVAPGVQAGGGVIETGGFKKFVAVVHTGGSAFNER